ncbi:MAG: hypothetical protein IKE95_09380 [Methanobrevibacter sp.]|nr:hypothetical protein [Methanobrevibacter sp.]
MNSGILINKSNFNINGNGHTIDGSRKARIFNIIESNITISNLIFINGFSQANGGAIFSNANVNLIGCVFENNSAVNGGAVYFSKGLTNSTIACTFNGKTYSATTDGNGIAKINSGSFTKKGTFNALQSC